MKGESDYSSYLLRASSKVVVGKVGLAVVLIGYILSPLDLLYSVFLLRISKGEFSSDMGSVSLMCRPINLAGLRDRRFDISILYGELPVSFFLYLWKNLQFERIITIIFRTCPFVHRYLMSFFLMVFYSDSK